MKKRIPYSVVVLAGIHMATGAVEQTISLFGSPTTNLYKYYFNTGITPGRLLRSVNAGDKFMMWYQPDNQQTYQENDDETLAFGFD